MIRFIVRLRRVVIEVDSKRVFFDVPLQISSGPDVLTVVADR